MDKQCNVGELGMQNRESRWMGTDFRTPKLGGGECVTESSRIGAEGSKSGGGEGVRHSDDIQSNGIEGSGWTGLGVS